MRSARSQRGAALTLAPCLAATARMIKVILGPRATPTSSRSVQHHGGWPVRGNRNLRALTLASAFIVSWPVDDRLRPRAGPPGSIRFWWLNPWACRRGLARLRRTRGNPRRSQLPGPGAFSDGCPGGLGRPVPGNLCIFLPKQLLPALPARRAAISGTDQRDVAGAFAIQGPAVLDHSRLACRPAGAGRPGRTASGLPAGTQVVGSLHEDDTVITFAQASASNGAMVPEEGPDTPTAQAFLEELRKLSPVEEREKTNVTSKRGPVTMAKGTISPVSAWARCSPWPRAIRACP